MTPEEIAAKAAEESRESSISRIATASGLPELTDAEKAAAAEAAGKGTAPTKTAEEIAAEAAAAGPSKLNPLWDKFSAKGIQVPDVLTSEEGLPEGVTEEDLLFQTIGNRVLSTLPPEVVDLYNHVSQNKPVMDYYKAKAGESSILDLPEREFATKYMALEYGKTDSNPDGLEADALEEEIEKLVESGDLRLKVVSWKKDLRKSLSSSESAETVQEIETKRWDNMVTNISKSIDVLYEKTLPDMTKIGGIEVSQEDLIKFRPMFEKIVLPDKKLGTSPFQLIQNDNEMLFKMIHALYQNPDTIRSMFSNANEDVKANVFKLLQLEPITISEGKEETSADVKIAKFASPDRN